MLRKALEDLYVVYGHMLNTFAVKTLPASVPVPLCVCFFPFTQKSVEDFKAKPEVAMET